QMKKLATTIAKAINNNKKGVNGIKPNRLYITQLHDELNRYKVNFDLKSTHTQLVNLLNETLKTQTKQNNTDTIQKYKLLFEVVDMTSHKKGGGKRIPKEVVELMKGYFHSRNTPDKSYLSAEDMMRELHIAVEMGHLAKEKIPQKVDTIRG
ncbi:730_t:CDS:2, partial [Funneliformis mosseae]